MVATVFSGMTGAGYEVSGHGLASGLQRSLPLDRWAAISGDLRPLPESRVFKLARHALGGKIWTWIGEYRYAFEPDGMRDGGFVGAAILLSDDWAAGREAIGYLDALHHALDQALLDKDTFRMRFDAFFEGRADFPWPEVEMRAVDGSLRALDTETGLTAGGDSALFLHVARGQLPWFVEWAQFGRDFTGLGTVYLTDVDAQAEQVRGLRWPELRTARDFAADPPLPEPREAGPDPAPAASGWMPPATADDRSELFGGGPIEIDRDDIDRLSRRIEALDTRLTTLEREPGPGPAQQRPFVREEHDIVYRNAPPSWTAHTTSWWRPWLMGTGMLIGLLAFAFALIALMQRIG